MSNAQLFLAIGIPSVLVVLAWITSAIQNSHIASRLASIEGDLRQFYATQGRHDKAIETIEKKVGL
jgi:hypothetical protein